MAGRDPKPVPPETPRSEPREPVTGVGSALLDSLLAPRTPAPESVISAPKRTRTRRTGPDVFATIDFETADRGRDSACQVAVVRVENGVITARKGALIRPPRRTFEFTYVHHIRWEDVANEPVFRDVWPSFLPLLEGARALWAHNASFDRSVLEACCAAAGLTPPTLDWECSMQLARRTWGFPRPNLAAVSAALGIALNHHEAGSDAEACAQIVLAARAKKVARLG